MEMERSMELYARQKHCLIIIGTVAVSMVCLLDCDTVIQQMSFKDIN